MRNKSLLTLLGLFFVQFQAVASGLLPTLPGVPTTTAEWATFLAYFVLTIVGHIPRLREWFAKRPAPVDESPSEPKTPEDAVT